VPQLALAPDRLAGSVPNQELQYVPNWTTTPPAPTIAPTTAPIASTWGSVKSLLLQGRCDRLLMDDGLAQCGWHVCLEPEKPLQSIYDT